GQLLDQLHRPDLVLAREGEADTLAHLLVDVVVDALVAMAEDDRPIPHPQVDVLVAIDVPDSAALAPVDVDRVITPHPEVRVRAAWHRPEGALVEGGLAFPAERRSWFGGGFWSHEQPRGAVLD